MATPHPASPQPDTGLPPGVEVGELGSRFVAYLIDALVPAVLGIVVGLVLPSASTGVRVVLSVVLAIVTLGWALFVLQGIAVRAASPGMRVMKLQLVGFYDGRPVGWARAVLRAVLFWLISATGVVLVVMLVLLVMHPRRQGWHDVAAQAVVIKERSLPPREGSGPSGVTAQLDQGSRQGTETPSAGDDRDPSYAAPPLTPPVQSPVAGSPVPPPYAAPARDPRPEPVPGPRPAPTPPSASSAGSSAYAADAPTWLAVLDDGRKITVDGLVLLGRNPQPQPGEEDAQLIKLADETRTVSKSHLAIGKDAAGTFVVDRGSTNGSTVTTPAGISSRCQPGQVTYVEPGSVVSLGDHWLEIRKV